MPRLRHLELQALSKSLLELYSPTLQTDLPAKLFAALGRHLPSDAYSYNELMGPTFLRAVREPDYSVDLDAFNHYAYQHPLLKVLTEGQIAGAVKISDFATLSQWQRSDLYNSFFRLSGFNYQLAFIALDREPALGIALNRSAADFSEGERFQLDLLKPHFALAFQNSRLFSYLSDAAEGNGQAWIVANSAGRILFETDKAIDLLKEYFGHNGSLPTQLRDWLKRRASGLLETNGLALPLKDFSIRRGTKRLIVRSLSPVQSPEHRLLLSETNEELDSRPLQALGLTKREAEVLLWISQGKRNSEIAEILGARSRTIGKHVERILGKLCVETRTAAANIATEVLHSR